MDYEKDGARVVYKNVQREKTAMAEMGSLGKGRRDAPATLCAERVAIGYGGS